MTIVGRSDYTREKQEDYASLVNMLLPMCWGASLKFPKADHDRVHVIELHAGDGGDEVAGSPLIVAAAAERRRRPVRLWLCEENVNVMASLQRRLDPACWAGVERRYLLGDHAETVGQIVRCYADAQPRFGWMYSDPNGDPLPVPVIRRLLAAGGMERMDVIASINATGAYKRRRQFHGHYLLDDLRSIGKKAIYIRHKRTGWQWTMVLMTNFPHALGLNKRGFYEINSATGQDILSDLNMSASERQMRLW